MSQISKVMDAVRRKAAYHHGDLRQALVNATRQLVIERGAENFTLSDACRLAGVSTAAPYKHFRDKDEILKEIIVQGFDEFSRRRREVLAGYPRGSIEGIIAIGQFYVQFAQEQSAIFRLMFGQNPRLKSDEHVNNRGMCCFSGVIEDVSVYCEVNGLKDDAGKLALELWTFVHGAACLAIDEDYDKVAPQLDIDRLIADVTPRLLYCTSP